jgi:hypothetical protein
MIITTLHGEEWEVPLEHGLAQVAWPSRHVLAAVHVGFVLAFYATCLPKAGASTACRVAIFLPRLLSMLQERALFW